MTTRIDVLAYWMITLCSAVASGQNFDRLLTPREYGMATRAPAARQTYRDGVRDGVRAAREYSDIDYQALREQVGRQYANEFGPANRPVVSAPPARNYEQRYEQFRSPYDYNRRPVPQELRDRAWHERELRRAIDNSDRPFSTESDHFGCPNGECSGHPDVRPIGYGYDSPYSSGCTGYGVAPAGLFDGPRGPTPNSYPHDYRAYRQKVDRDGNYVSDNLYGDPRIFNPDQPVRNLFRYVFP
jgi:hypothetical protein